MYKQAGNVLQVLSSGLSTVLHTLSSIYLHIMKDSKSYHTLMYGSYTTIQTSCVIRQIFPRLYSGNPGWAILRVTQNGCWVQNWCWVHGFPRRSRQQPALEIAISNWNPMGNMETSSCSWIDKMPALKHRTKILQFWVFFVALSPLVFVSHNPPLWESGAWLTGLQNQIQGPPSSQALSSQDPNSTFAKTTFNLIPLTILSWQKGSTFTFFGWSDKANTKVKELRFWWEFPNWMFWELSHFPDPAPVTSH